MECCHIADNALQRSRDCHLCHEQIRKYPVRISRLFVSVVLCVTLYANCLAALMCIR